MPLQFLIIIEVHMSGHNDLLLLKFIRNTQILYCRFKIYPIIKNFYTQPFRIVLECIEILLKCTL